MRNDFSVRYIGEDAAEIRNGEIYSAYEPADSTAMYAVRDRSREYYAYPKRLFEVVGE